MRKIYPFLGAMAILASSMSATSIEGRINLIDKVKVGKTDVPMANENLVTVTSSSNVGIRPLQIPSPQKASVEQKSVVLYEDFNNVPDGATEMTGNIGERYVDFIASRFCEPGRYINNDYTPESGTWEGNWIFAGKGGTIILQCYNPMQAACLNTPLGDYSGDITVTVRARSSKTFWGADNEMGYITTDGSSLALGACIHGYDKFDPAITDMGYTGQIATRQIYEDDGWQELTFKFHNESANRDSYLSFLCSTAIEIDWIKVTDDNTFVAAPVINAPTDFQNDGFTINWDPVRRAYSYFIDLWKTVYTADSGLDNKCNFDTGSVSEWISCADAEIVDKEGYEGSKALLISYDGTNGGFSTVDQGIKLESFSSKVKFAMEDIENRVKLLYDVYGENGWEPFGYLECDGVWTFPDYYYNVALDGDLFAGMYTAVRVYAEGTNEDNMIYVDDVAIFAKRPYVLERLAREVTGAINDPDNDDYNYNYYTSTGVGKKYDPQDPGRKGTSYKFVGLDPETEYWYRVRSHNGTDFCTSEKYHALGVAAPELLTATNATTGSYTANWKDAPKAQKYIVSNYAATIISEDSPEHSFLLEGFSSCQGEPYYDLMEPVGNSFDSYLDDYTDLNGWRGKNNYFGQNMLGTVDYTDSYLITPVMMVNPNRGPVMVYIEAHGYIGDTLIVKCLKSGTVGYFAFEDETLSGWFEIPAVEGEQIRFSSYNYLGFALSAFEVTQSVKAGDVVRVFDSSVEVYKGDEAYTFSNLDNDIYAYGVVSVFTLEGETAYSTATNAVVVDLGNGESFLTNGIKPSAIDNPEEVARYSIDGIQVDNGYKGIVIIRNNDGSVTKKIVR